MGAHGYPEIQGPSPVVRGLTGAPARSHAVSARAMAPEGSP